MTNKVTKKKSKNKNKTSVEKIDNSLKLSYQMCFALYSTSRAITKQYSVLLEKMGLTYPQYLVMLILWENDGLTVREIAKSLELEGATTTPLIQRMEKLDLVIRKRGIDDERCVYVHLTPKGEGLKTMAKNVPDALGCAIGVDEKLARQIVSQMNAIKSSLKAK